MDEKTKEWIKEQAMNYKACLLETVKAIPVKLNGSGLELSASDIKDISTSLYIQGQKAGVFHMEGYPNAPRYNDDEPATPEQQKFIATLCMELGKSADEVVDQQLRINGKATVEAFTKNEATQLITVLKEEKLAKRRKARS